VHLHGDAGLPLAHAAQLAGVACVDTSGDDSWLGESSGVENLYVAGRCARLYHTAWQRQAAFADAQPPA
jgi:hypothetical protein